MERDEARSKIIVALDVDKVSKAINLVKPLIGKVGGFKLGFEFIYSTFESLITSPSEDRAYDIVDELRVLFRMLDEGEFIDGKIGDIPTTVKGASKAITRLRPLMFNMHAFVGPAAIRAAREGIDTIAKEAGLRRKPLLLAVTLLTTITEDDLVALGLKPEDATEDYRLRLVVRYAKLAQRNGADGVIASPKEVAAIRESCGPDFIIITPGVRLPGANRHDQKNVDTPGNSIAAGANGVVVGRNITEAADPVAATELVIDNILEVANASISA